MHFHLPFTIYRRSPIADRRSPFRRRSEASPIRLPTIPPGALLNLFVKTQINTWTYFYDARYPPDSGIPRFGQKHSKNTFWQLFQYTQKTLKKQSGTLEKCGKTFKKHSPECFLSVFAAFWDQNWAPARAARSRKNPPPQFWWQKPFKNCQKRLRKRFLESFSTFLGVAGEFLETFLRVFGEFLAGFGKVAKTSFLMVFVEFLINQT